MKNAPKKVLFLVALGLPVLFIFILEKITVLLFSGYDVEAITYLGSVIDVSSANGKNVYLLLIAMLTRAEQFVSFLFVGFFVGILPFDKASRSLSYLIFAASYFSILIIYRMSEGLNNELFVVSFFSVFMVGFFSFLVAVFSESLSRELALGRKRES